jgi:hypothetical protein
MACKFCLYALTFIGVSNRNIVPRNRTIFELIKPKYGTSRLSKLRKQNVIVRISPSNYSAREKEKRHDDKMDMHIQILNTMCSQYARISESVLIAQNVRLPGKRAEFNFTEIRLHKIR